MSVQGSSRQSKAEIQADKNRLSQICLSILEMFWYLWYPRDSPRDAKSLGRSLCLWGAVFFANLHLTSHFSLYMCTMTAIFMPPSLQNQHLLALLSTASPSPCHRLFPTAQPAWPSEHQCYRPISYGHRIRSTSRINTPPSLLP
jgi:hypothetical protein